MVEQRFVSLDVLNNGAVRADGIDGSEIQIENHLPQPERCTSRHDDDETARRGTSPGVRRVRSETDPRNAKKSRPNRSRRERTQGTHGTTLTGGDAIADRSRRAATLRTARDRLEPRQTRPGPLVQFDTCPATEDSPRQANHVRGSAVS